MGRRGKQPPEKIGKAADEPRKPVAEKPQTPPSISWRVHFAIALSLLLLAGGVFAPILGHDFLRWDDWLLIGENPRLQSPSWDNLMAFWRETGTGFQELYTPLTYSVMWLLARLVGLRPEIFHGASIAMHIVNTLLVYWLATRLVRAEGVSWKAALAAGITGAIFAVHPLQVESVAWASSLNTLLACTLSLAAVLAWVVCLQQRPGGWIVPLLLSAGFAVLACLCKPSAIVLPGLLAAVDWLVLRRGWRHAILPAGAIGLTVLPFAIIAMNIQQAANVMAPLWARPLIALDAIGFYTAQLFAPVRLMSDYGRSPGYVISRLSWPWYIVLGGAILIAAGLLYRKTPAFAWAVVLFVVALFPVLGLSNFQFQWYSTVADRYVYLPLAMALPVLAVLLARMNVRALAPAAVVVLAALAARSYVQLPVWANTLRWAEHQIHLNPDSSAGHRVLGEHYVRAEDEARGEQHYLRALELRPDDTIVLYNMGNMRLRQDRAGEALDLYIRAINADARSQGVYNNGFLAAQRANRLEDFGRAVAGTLKRRERNPFAHSYMGWVYLMTGDVRRAQQHFLRALQLAPGLASAQNGLNKIVEAQQ